MKKIAILLAGGSGIRLNKSIPKCLYKLNGKESFKYSLDKFIRSNAFDLIVLVLPKICKQFFHKKILVVKAGKTRNESFENAMESIKKIVKSNDTIVVHDACRIFVDINDIRCIAKSKESFATLCYKATDTMFLNKKNQKELTLLPRSCVNIQTPQMCKYSTYLKAKKNKNGTDLISYLNLKLKENNLIYSSNGLFNIKITYPEDLIIANKLLRK